MSSTVRKMLFYERDGISLRKLSRYASNVVPGQPGKHQASVIRVVLANQHPIIRASLRQLLHRDELCRVIGEAAKSEEAVWVSSYQSPDVIILDFKLGTRSGLNTAREIVRSSKARIIFFSERAEEEYLWNALEAGASGFVLSDSLQEDLLAAVQSVAAGGRFVSPRVIEGLLGNWGARGAAQDKLSEVEKQAVLLLTKGLNREDLARSLGIGNDALQKVLEDVRDKAFKAGVPITLMD